ncbi:MAG: hypothetical protein JF586_12220 [Burkholderiales bacterium]|nr:hypothetical protein [Burkholderiales bacterium]
MARSRRSDRWGPSIGYLVIALGLAAGAVAGWWPATGTPPPQAGAAASAASSAAPRIADTSPGASAPAPARAAAARDASGPVPASASPRIPRVRPPGTDQTPDITAYINDGEKPTMKEVIDRLHAAGVHGGLGAFNPPGTKPPLVGLAVPEDFVLPPGYVRHYQATDDGQRIEPILMFAPDFQPTAADGRPVAVPRDRVVPPELAPPGLPIRRIVIPTPIEGR